MMPVVIGMIVAIAAPLATGAQVAGDPPAGADSRYTDALTDLLRHWKAKAGADSASVESSHAEPIELDCIGTPHDEDYVGIVRRTTIRASLRTVEAVLDDVAHFKELFPRTVEVRVVAGSSQGSEFTTAWEQRVPLFLVPNIRYELSHTVDKSTPGIGVYRYRLRSSNTLIASDGLAILEARGPETTRFSEYNFFKARPSPVPASVIWRESLRSAVLSNFAIKLKAENPGWSYERIASEAAQLLALRHEMVERCVAERKATPFVDDSDGAAARR